MSVFRFDVLLCFELCDSEVCCESRKPKLFIILSYLVLAVAVTIVVVVVVRVCVSVCLFAFEKRMR